MAVGGEDLLAGPIGEPVGRDEVGKDSWPLCYRKRIFLHRFGRTRFWYLVAPGSGISREISRIYFWNLTGRPVIHG
jgi:hypothetical protein